MDRLKEYSKHGSAIVEIVKILYIEQKCYNCENVNNMPLAFILLNSKIGTEHTVLEKIKSLEKNENIDLHEVSVIYGVYDLIVKHSANNMDELKEFITSKIRSLEEVSSSLTLIEVDQDDSDED